MLTKIAAKAASQAQPDVQYPRKFSRGPWSFSPSRMKFIFIFLYNVFCSTSLPLTSTRGFNQHFHAFHSFRNAADKSQQHQECISSEKFVRKILGNAEDQTQGCWVRSANVTSVLCCPPDIMIGLYHLKF